MKSLYKKIFIIIFVVILIIPITLICVEKITKKPVITSQLMGITQIVEFPKLTLDKYVKGNFQKYFENYWATSFPGRVYLIRIYNQLRYSFFSLNGSWRQQDSQQIIGKDGSIFHEYYITDALQYQYDYDFSKKENQQKCISYVENLEKIHEILEKNGKHLLFFITPSKAHFLYNEIPERYYYKKRELNHASIDAADFLTSQLSNTKINWYDSRNDIRKLNNEGIPVFYKTGIHMSRPADQQLTIKLLEHMNAISRGQYPQLKLDYLNNSMNPFWRDQDVYLLLNIFSGKKDKCYYQYSYSKLTSPTLNNKTILVQGGSFAESFTKDFIEQKLGDTCYRIFYKQMLYTNEAPDVLYFKKWSDLDMKELINKSNFILIEVNDAAINAYNNGFVEYLKLYLEKYYIS